MSTGDISPSSDGLFVWYRAKTDSQHKNRCFSVWCWLQNSWKQYLNGHHRKVNDNSPTAVSDVSPEVTRQVKPPAVPSWLCPNTGHRRLWSRTIRGYGTWFNASSWFKLLITTIYGAQCSSLFLYYMTKGTRTLNGVIKDQSTVARDVGLISDNFFK